jgi:pimeloyl-ACP methyl ester carboxylesterase
MSAIILQNEIIHYEVLGRGRPVVFIHGWVGSWRYWIPNMQAASINFRAYAIDLWGFGDTAKEPDKYPLEQQTALLDDFLAEMGIGKIAIIGHGLGAVIGMMFADRYPDYIDRVMAISLPFESQTINPRIKKASPAELADWLLGDTVDSQAARLEAPKADRQAILQSIDNLSLIQISELARKIHTPSLLVFGQNDPAIDMINSNRLISLPDHMHHIIFNQSGHFPMLDQVNKFNRLMNDFLSLASGESPQQLQLKEEWKRRIR